MAERTMKTRLLQLNCHFTWRLLEKNCEIDEIEERMHNQLEFLFNENRYMMYNLLAYVKHLQGNNTEAITNLDKAEKSSLACSEEGNIKLLVTYGNYAWVYYHLNQNEKSQLYIDKVEQIYEELNHSSPGKDKFPEVYGEQGWSMLKFGRLHYEKAKECFEKALKEAPEDPEFNSGYATVIYRLESFQNSRSPDYNFESLELLKRAVKLNPKDSVVKALLGLLLQDLKKGDEGLKYIEEALEQTPDLPYLLRYVAKFYRKAGMTDKALSVLKRAVDLIPNSAFHHHQIGLCYRNKMIEKKKLAHADHQNRRTYTREIQDLIQKAIYHFEKSVEFKKSHIYARTDLANMYKDANQYLKAEETFKNTFAIKPMTDQEKQQVHFYYGSFQQYAKKCEREAIEQYKKALLIPATSFEKEKCEKALKRIAERKISENPTDASGFGLLGFVYQIQKNTSEAIECYGKALKLEPYNEDYLSSLCELKLTI